MPRGSISLSLLDIQTARQSGRLTFRPVSGGRLVCNQVPGLGHLSAKQAESLRGQVWPKAGASKTKEAATLLRVPIRKYASWNQQHDYVTCKCGKNFSHVKVDQELTCDCGRRLVVTK